MAVQTSHWARDEGGLVCQLLTESTLLALIGGALGLFVARATLIGLLTALGPRLPRATEISMDVPVLLFALAISLLTGILFGLAPARTLLRTSLTSSLWRRRPPEGTGAGKKQSEFAGGRRSGADTHVADWRRTRAAQFRASTGSAERIFAGSRAYICGEPFSRSIQNAKAASAILRSIPKTRCGASGRGRGRFCESNSAFRRKRGMAELILKAARFRRIQGRWRINASPVRDYFPRDAYSDFAWTGNLQAPTLPRRRIVAIINRKFCAEIFRGNGSKLASTSLSTRYYITGFQ